MIFKKTSNRTFIYNRKHTVRLVCAMIKTNRDMKNAVYVCLILLLAAGCGNDRADKTTKPGKIRVNTAVTTSVSRAGGLSYSGTVEASQTIPLTFQITGTVEQVLVDAGDEVKKGQVLARLDNNDMQNIRLTMQAKYDQAKDAYDRLKTVYEKGSLPEIKWMEMKTNLEQAKSALDLAQNNLDKCILTAPASGMVGRRNIEPGQSSINLTAAPIELVKIEKVLVRIAVPEKEINRIRKAMEAEITVPAAGGALLHGRVTNISPVAELISRTYTVKIAVSNPELMLKPGMVCDVVLNSGGERMALTVPYPAVGHDANGKNFVYLVEPGSGSVKKQPVVAGQIIGSGIEIREGLKEGDTVVTGGLGKLSDHSLIEL